MLPKGDLTRDQLSQLLLVYIGTAADIIEFFDSFKDDKIAAEPLLVLLTLGIWSWSLMQFTVVLTATKSRKSRLSSTGVIVKNTTKSRCCSIDVWGIAINITLQDAPFLVFRLLLITHFKIISYMNVFFTCKNTLVILLQLYRLYVVYSENKKKRKKKRKKNDFELTNISIISKPDMYTDHRKKSPKRKQKKNIETSESEESSECYEVKRKLKNYRKDTGYSTASSHTSNKNKLQKLHSKDKNINTKKREKISKASSKSSCEEKYKEDKRQRKLKRSDKDTKGHTKLDMYLYEESESEESTEVDEERVRCKIEKRHVKNEGKKNKKSSPTVSVSDASSE